MPQTPKADKPLIRKDIPLKGKLQTFQDPTTIGANFSILRNLRYTDTNIRGVRYDWN